jgi:tetratricopeptide (TPR) repeat protein
MKIFKNREIGMISLTLVGLVLMTSKLFSQDLSTALKFSQSERYEDADSVFKEVLKANPANGDVYFFYGENNLKSYVADPYSNAIDAVVKEVTGIFKKGIASDSLNPLNYVGLGMVILLDKNDTSAADVYFKKAEQTFPKSKKRYTEKNILTLIKLAQAQLYAKEPRYQKATNYLEKAVDIAPKNTDAYVALGEIYESQNNASEAVKNYNKAVYINPKLTVPLVKIGNLYMRSRNLEAARDNFDKAKAIDSTYAPLYRGLGEMYSLSGHDNFSIFNYKKFLALSGNNIPAKIQYLISLFRAKKYSEALILAEEIMNYDKSRNYLNRIAAYSSYEKKPADYQKALKYIETLIQNSQPEKIIAKDYAYYGRTLLKLKDSSLVDKAFDKLQLAYKMDTSDQDLIYDIAVNAYVYKKYDLSTKMMNKKIAYGKPGINDYMLLGKGYYQSAKYEKADSIFRIVIKTEPKYMLAWTWKASTYVQMDPNSTEGKAEPIYETIIQIGLTDTVKYLNDLFTAYSYLGSYYLYSPKPNFNISESYYRKIVKLDSKNKAWQIKGLTSLAVIETKRKNLKKAYDYYGQVLILDPGNTSVLAAQKSIKTQMDINEVNNQLNQ